MKLCADLAAKLSWGKCDAVLFFFISLAFLFLETAVTFVRKNTGIVGFNYGYDSREFNNKMELSVFIIENETWEKR